MWRRRAATESNLRASTPLGGRAAAPFSIPPKLHRVDEESESSNAAHARSPFMGLELNHAGQPPPPPAEFIAGRLGRTRRLVVVRPDGHWHSLS